MGPVEEMDTGAEGDGESVAEDKSETGIRTGKKRERNSPDPRDSQVKKKKDLKQSPPQVPAAQNIEKKKASAWQTVLSRKERKKQRKDQLPKEPRPEPKRKKPRKVTRPDALIIRPVEKANYAEILRRIKKDVPDEQVCNTVDKIRKTRDGNMLITLSRRSTDKGQALQKTIASILKEEAEVISKCPQEQLEIRDLDDTTTTDDVLAALQKAAGDSYKIPIGAIKIRPAYRGTKSALVTLPTATAQTVLGERGKIKIGWVNCRVRAVKRPQPCFKCWHYGHVAAQCISEVNRSKLCIKCGQADHQVAKCPNKAKCMLCAEKPSSTDITHRAGSSQCPIFQEALQKITNKRA
ncbi:uncharacterized protein [Chelonus insularis]|uniref:uncharacterized protein n=1 Tax=Chelonus insularis TaxID=460826 RepID=UPI00158E9F5F|nr:uncharacterized protein LOC118070547 [Chelonus insularis]